MQFKGQNLAVFPKKSHAIRAAVAIAYATATPDAPTTVLDKGSGGESYTLWTYGKDAYTAA